MGIPLVIYGTFTGFDTSPCRPPTVSSCFNMAKLPGQRHVIRPLGLYPSLGDDVLRQT
jgi:hypothetical protein